MAAGNRKKTVKNEKRLSFSFFTDMDAEKKSNILKYSGIAVMVFALFSFVSVLSYLFTWSTDQSLMSHPEMMDRGVEVANWAGKVGYKWASLWVGDCFGLGSFALIFLLCACGYRLFCWDRRIGLLRLTFLSVSGAFLSSLILAYCSLTFSDDVFFGGGLGGDAGHAVILWMQNLFGGLVPAFILLVLAIAWMLSASGRFAAWFSELGKRKEPKTVAVEPEVGVETIEVPEVVQEPEPEVELGQETQWEPEYEPILEPEVDLIPEVDPEVDSEPEVDQVEDFEPVVSPGLVEESEPAAGVPELEVIEGVDFTEEVVEELPRIDNRMELERYEFPSLDLLKDYSDGQHKVSQQEIAINNARITSTLQNYKIEVEKVTAIVGPTVTLYKVVPAPGVRVAAIENLHREIAMSLGATGVRVVTLPDSVGIEVPNSTPTIVPLKSMLNAEAFRESDAELPIAIGYTITQEVKTFDLTDAPHLLVAGATKQGKSVGLNVIISSLLYAKHPTELKFVFIDPKMVEFTSYNSLLKHYLAVLPNAVSEEDERKNAIVKSPKQAEQILNSLCIEMDERYNLLASAGVNDFKLYNEKYKDRYLRPDEGHKFLPYLVVVIDEYADLIMAGGASQEAKKAAKNIEASIVRLAQKGRAAGIHVIIATQRPSVNVITGLIKANFPTRIAFRVLSGTDSRTILDSTGAENLIGKGDMLYYAGVKMERVQCALVSMAEINKITKFIGDQTGWKKCCSTPYYLPVPESQDGESGGGTIDMQNIDPMFEDAARMVVNTQKGSTSDLQRRLGMGYARAGRVMDQLEAAGIVGPQEGSKPRQVLISNILELDEVLSAFVKD